MGNIKDEFWNEFFDSLEIDEPLWFRPETKKVRNETTYRNIGNSRKVNPQFRNDSDSVVSGTKRKDDTNSGSQGSVISFKFYCDVLDTAEDAAQILLKKHEDYGPDNIAKAPGGALNGLTVRLHDKVARLSNLLDTGKEPNNESIYDTFLDIANYGIIGMLVLDGKWDSGD